MKKRLSLIAVSLVMVQLLSVLTLPCYAAVPQPHPGIKELPFQDVSREAWYYDTLFECYRDGIVYGISDTEFALDAPMTRAQFMSLLGREFAYYLYCVENPEPYSYEDVPVTSYYAKYIYGAKKCGVVYGTSETRFSPDAPITREQAATLVLRAINAYHRNKGLLPENPAPANYEDRAEIAPYALKAVDTLKETGIMVGDENDCFLPGKLLTRVEAAALMYRIRWYGPRD